MSFRLSEPIVDRLLDLLSSDDDFRARFARDARDALAFIGYLPAANPVLTEGAWWCLKVESLASKEAILQGRAELRRQFTMEFLPQLPFALDTRFQMREEAA
jgi:putative modified peptide